MRGLSFCLLHRYAFEGIISETGLGDPRIVDVTIQLERGNILAPLILAEIVAGLDNRRACLLHCGVRLLQIWLME